METATVLDRDVLAESILARKGLDRLSQEVGKVLTLDEMYMLCLVASGFTNEEIADRLDLSLQVAESQLSEISKRINAPNRFQAALWATENL